MKDHLSKGLDRRTFLAAAPALGLAAQSTLARNPSPANAGNILWYKRPAAQWVEALPLGNGRLGAMVFGGAVQERLQLNEDTLWAGSPYNPVNPQALEALPEVRELLAGGNFDKAYEIAQARMMAQPLRQMPYGTLGDIFLTFRGQQIPSAYERRLDLATAIAATSFTNRTGTFNREVFVSRPDQVVVVHLTANGHKATLDFDIGHRGPGPGHYISWDYQGAATTVDATGPDWLHREAVMPLPDSIKQATDGNGAILITGRNEESQGIAAGLTYAVRLAVRSDGKILSSNGLMSIKGAKSVTLVIAAATSYVNFQDTTGDPVAIVRAQSEAAIKLSRATLKSRHIADHRSLFDRVKLELGGISASPKPTQDRIVSSVRDHDPQLEVLYFNFGRYLLISSSRAGSQPANLQGIWNEGTNPPWDSKYTLNINTEMNYWPAQACGLETCVEPLVRLVEELAVTGEKTARSMYGARGWMAHHNTDLWRATAPIDGAFWGLWPCGGAWLCKPLWDHYDYNPDLAFLTRIYPLLRGASEFFMDVLVDDAQGRGLITSPSLSPENAHPYGTSLCAGPAMDRQIIRDLFYNTLRADALLGHEPTFYQALQLCRDKIAPDRIGAQGQLQEWLEDWDLSAPEQHHRHVSHLYAVYPSEQINIRDTPGLASAAKVSLRTRGDLATGWGTAWRACLWARLGEGDHAHAILQSLIGPDRTYPNLFDACPPFQIDGNFGGTAAIVEMLLQSWGGEILILPALPFAWQRGSVSGLRARGGITVAMEWVAGSLVRLSLRGPANRQLALRYRGRLTQVTLDGHGNYAGKLLST